MDSKDLSRWFWDIAKYVVSAIIISSFLGGFKDNPIMLYGMSFTVVAAFILAGIYFHERSKRK
jgi:hypothetical protein